MAPTVTSPPPLPGRARGAETQSPSIVRNFYQSPIPGSPPRAPVPGLLEATWLKWLAEGPVVRRSLNSVALAPESSVKRLPVACGWGHPHPHCPPRCQGESRPQKFRSGPTALGWGAGAR